uniref:Secreted protein n=1 Tax=Syphacia muris TaxID=451379 RepID=A0A0N5ASB2_9BILA
MLSAAAAAVVVVADDDTADSDADGDTADAVYTALNLHDASRLLHFKYLSSNLIILNFCFRINESKLKSQ